MIRPPPTSTLFPYTTLFRSSHHVRTTAGKHSDHCVLAEPVQHLVEEPVAAEDVDTVCAVQAANELGRVLGDRKSTRLNSSHQIISYAVFCLKKKNNTLPRGP